MMSHVPVTELEVQSAKLQIEVLERLGRPVDERLRQLAGATPLREVAWPGSTGLRYRL